MLHAELRNGLKMNAAARTTVRPSKPEPAGSPFAAPWPTKVKSAKSTQSPGTIMSSPADHSANATHHTPAHEPDAVEAIVPLMPLVLPLAGGVLMFLLAFIAVFMA
jgi:hypothetical protein